MWTYSKQTVPACKLLYTGTFGIQSAPACKLQYTGTFWLQYVPTSKWLFTGAFLENNMDIAIGRDCTFLEIAIYGTILMKS